MSRRIEGKMPATRSHVPAMTEIARLDLRDFESGDAARRARFAMALRSGLEASGFVRISGHGIGKSLIEDVYQACADFFALPQEIKDRYSGVAGGQRGYTPRGVECAKDHAVPDLKEFFHVGQPQASMPPRCQEYARNIWPAEVPELRGRTHDLFHALETCSERLLEALEIGYAVEAHQFSDLVVRGNSILRAVHYPPVPGDVDPRALRAAPHEDINLITLLCGATDSGLEILTPDGAWLSVETVPDELVVDAGDMLSRITNDVIPSTTHRVSLTAASRTDHRYSLPFFAHPRPDALLSVLPQFIPEGEAPKSAPIHTRDFLAQRLRAIGLL